MFLTLQLGEKAQQEAVELDEAKSKHEIKLKVQEGGKYFYSRFCGGFNMCY